MSRYVPEPRPRLLFGGYDLVILAHCLDFRLLAVRPRR